MTLQALSSGIGDLPVWLILASDPFQEDQSSEKLPLTTCTSYRDLLRPEIYSIC